MKNFRKIYSKLFLKKGEDKFIEIMEKIMMELDRLTNGKI